MAIPLSPSNQLHQPYELFAKSIFAYFSGIPALKNDFVNQLNSLGYSIDRVFNDPNTSFQALGLIYKDSTRPPVLISQGTIDDTDHIDNANPLGVGFSQFTANKVAIENWLTSIQSATGLKADLTGHSLGAALTQWFASEFPNLIHEAVTFNSPGISKAGTINFTNKGGTPSQITHYIVNGDLVSLGGEAFLPGTLRVGDYQTAAYDPEQYFDKHYAAILNNSLPLTNISVTNELIVNFDAFNQPTFTFSGQDWQDLLDKVRQSPIFGTNAGTRSAAEQLRATSGRFDFVIFQISAFLQSLIEIGVNRIGSPLADKLDGTNRKDNLSGLAGNDTLNGGDGDDRLSGGTQNDIINGGEGDDTLIGSDPLIPDTDADTLDGGEGRDTYEASGTQAQYDTFKDTGTSGIDTLKNTGSTALTLNSFSATNGVEVIDGNNRAIVGNNLNNVLNFSNVSFTNVLYVDGGVGNDSIVGTAFGDDLRGSAGNDTLNGGAGDDRLDGGSQNDSLIGGIGNDTLIGGSEVDTLDGGEDSDTYEASGVQAEFDTFKDTGTTGTDTLKNTGSTALTLNGFSASNGIDVIDGNNQAIVGNNLNNVLDFSNVRLTNVLYVDGGVGNDSIVGTVFGDDLRGSAGDDTLKGGAGDDRLDGGSQNDSLIGGAGNDTIIGGQGFDNLSGGAGVDAFVLNNSGEGIDTIGDFLGDRFNISRAGFGAAVGNVGTLTADRFTLGTAATTANHRFVYNNATGALFFDVDGTGANVQVQIAQLIGNPALTNNNFSIV